MSLNVAWKRTAGGRGLALWKRPSASLNLARVARQKSQGWPGRLCGVRRHALGMRLSFDSASRDLVSWVQRLTARYNLQKEVYFKLTVGARGLRLSPPSWEREGRQRT